MANNKAWETRKRIVIGTLLYCAATIAYIVYQGADTKLNESVTSSLILLAGAVINGFIFGRVVDSHSERVNDNSNSGGS